MGACNKETCSDKAMIKALKEVNKLQSEELRRRDFSEKELQKCVENTVKLNAVVEKLKKQILELKGGSCE